MEEIGKLVDCYAFSKSPYPSKGRREPQAPPPVSRMVRAFIGETQPGSEKFWDQICEVAHPNGKTLMSFGGILQEGRFDPPSFESNEGRLFLALYNCLNSCCWLVAAMLDFDILCEHIRYGAPPPDDPPLVREKALIDRVVDSVSVEDGGKGSTDRTK